MKNDLLYFIIKIILISIITISSILTFRLIYILVITEKTHLAAIKYIRENNNDINIFDILITPNENGIYKIKKNKGEKSIITCYPQSWIFPIFSEYTCDNFIDSKKERN